jgi:alpha-L-fucosidase 2
LGFQGHAFEPMHSSGKQGVEVECRARVLHKGGRSVTRDSSLVIDQADSVTLIVAVATSYGGRHPGRSCADSLTGRLLQKLRCSSPQSYRGSSSSLQKSAD